MTRGEVDIYEEIVRLRHAGVPAAVATIVEAQGSAPQKTGAKMLVKENAIVAGTLGGGCMEAEVFDLCRLAIRDGLPKTIPFNLTESDAGLLCGGKILVYIEPILPDPHLVILGAGHVGRALTGVARAAGFRVTVADDRPDCACLERLPEASGIVVCDIAHVFDRVTADDRTYILVATRGHTHDFDAVKAALRTPARYIGLVGSKAKRQKLFTYLAEAGFSEDDRNRVVTPAGLQIGSVTPEEIAISIVAQLIQIRREGKNARGGPAFCSGRVEEDGTRQAEAASAHRG